MYGIEWTQKARDDYSRIKNDVSQQKRHKAVKKAITFLVENPRHNSLQTHQYFSLEGPNGEKVYEAYAEQNTPAAYRIFRCYGPARETITIIAITPHP